jgi:hypothetical protein
MQIRLHAMYGHSKSFYLWYQTTVLQHLRDADKQLIFVVSVLCIGELMSMASLSIAKCVLFFLVSYICYWNALAHIIACLINRFPTSFGWWPSPPRNTRIFPCPLTFLCRQPA